MRCNWSSRTTHYLFDQDSDQAVHTRVAQLASLRSLGARLGTAHLHATFQAM
jgi:hypothetical protein